MLNAPGEAPGAPLLLWGGSVCGWRLSFVRMPGPPLHRTHRKAVIGLRQNFSEGDMTGDPLRKAYFWLAVAFVLLGFLIVVLIFGVRW